MKPAQSKAGLRRQLLRLAHQIKNQQHLNHILSNIPDPQSRRHFYANIKPALRFKSEYPMEATHGY